MKIAFVHDWISHEGGAEAVLRDIIAHTIQEHNGGADNARIFVFYSDKTEFAGLPIVTAMPGWMNSLFVWANRVRADGVAGAGTKPLFWRTLLDYRNLMFWFPVLCWALRRKIMRYGADEVVISSFAAAKNVVGAHGRQRSSLEAHSPCIGNDKTIKENVDRVATYDDMQGVYSLSTREDSCRCTTSLYLHSPMQYIRENYTENYSKLHFPIKQFYWLATRYLRPRDRAPRTYHHIEANSHYTARIASQLYGWDIDQITIRYPRLDPECFTTPLVDTPRNYFVFVGRVQRYVREIDKIIALFNASGETLLIIGDGPDMDYARSIAGPTITFLGQINDVHEKLEIMRHARGCINLAKESFGLVTAESLCLGVPVFGYAGGATPELVRDGIDGVLVETKDAAGLAAGWKRFVNVEAKREELREWMREKMREKH